MAFDGLTLAALTDELSRTLTGGRISKIAMPEKDELLITIKNGETYRLLISAGASLPLMYLMDENKLSPPAAPAFCMLLRKHIGSAMIVSIRQIGLERIIEFELEHHNELGDLCRKKLIVELMGKYSNIIFCDDKDIIIDSIKRIPSTVSSIREVLPGRQYYLPESLKKISPLHLVPEDFDRFISLSKEASGKALCTTFEGISPIISEEVCFRAGIDSDKPYSYLKSDERIALTNAFLDLMKCAREGSYSPCLIIELAAARPVDFSAVVLHSFKDAGYELQKYDSISRLLYDFYSAREIHTRMRQKSADLRRITVTALERASKKYDLQQKQLNDCKSKEKYKVYGDLLNTYGYSLNGGEKCFTCENYYDGNREITIPLDEHKTASENAKRFFDRYAKLRRTEEALKDEITKTQNDIAHLSSILTSIDIAISEAELSQIKDELSEYGYIKKHSSGRIYGSGASSAGKRPGLKAEPLHFISSDGYDIYVGKNNYQNEEVSFKIAGGNDLWFHVKNAPGSHVIVKTKSIDIKELPDRLFSEAAGLAAWFSSKKDSNKVEVDYTYRRNLKRVPSGPPGFVIYHTNYSMLAEPRLLPPSD